MKNIYDKPIPETPEKREKVGKNLTHVHKFTVITAFVTAILAIACLVGVVVLFFVLEFSSADETLLFILMGALFVATLVFAVLAYVLMYTAGRLEKRKGDYFERCDSEESFFVGEGTLATFEEEALVLHADGRNSVRVPFREMRFMSVCTRRAPREKGTWSVVFEIPAHYILKDAKKGKNEPPALVQTDMKPRLLRVLEERNLTLLGELPPAEAPAKKKFSVEKKFSMPHKKKRQRALIILFVGAAVALGGIPLAFYADLTIGIIVSMVGLVVLGKSLHSYFRAKAVLAIYKEGVFWKDIDATENVFLKWEEVDRLALEEQEELPVLAAYCIYGAYRFPLPANAWEYLQEHYESLCE